MIPISFVMLSKTMKIRTIKLKHTIKQRPMYSIASEIQSIIQLVKINFYSMGA